MTLLFALLILGSALQAGLSAFLLLEVWASVKARLPPVAGHSEVAHCSHPTTAILMPAHNEAAGIARGVRSALAELGPADRLLVIADNCSDNTAAVARELGAEVVERSDAQRRGKGFALDFGLRQLGDHPPAVVLVVDADCELAPGSLAVLARRAVDSGRPQQALDLMLQPEGVTALRARVSEFAWRVKNQVRPLGAKRIGLPCQLMGTGMAFPWSSLEEISLATASIVEDMQLGVELALRGTPVAFCPEARVTSEFPVAGEDASAQRRRWEHGHLGIITQTVPSMLIAALRRSDYRLLGLCLDLAVPPLAFFAMAQLLWFVLVLAIALIAGVWAPALLSAASIALLTLALLAAWQRWGRDLIAAGELLRLPVYMIAKIPMYLAFWTGRQTAWVRARRD
ncbi:MAG: glycosyltransferase family 2 protein [Halieaceae bacterium]|nr:glycosyltransferase family 2 protein [Halieaceae bacterium]